MQWVWVGVLVEASYSVVCSLCVEGVFGSGSCVPDVAELHCTMSLVFVWCSEPPPMSLTYTPGMLYQ